MKTFQGPHTVQLSHVYRTSACHHQSHLAKPCSQPASVSGTPQAKQEGTSWVRGSGHSSSIKRGKMTPGQCSKLLLQTLLICPQRLRKFSLLTHIGSFSSVSCTRTQSMLISILLVGPFSDGLSMKFKSIG